MMPYTPVSVQSSNISWFLFVQLSMEENNKQLLKLLINFMEGLDIFMECVLIFLSLSCNLIMWYELDKKEGNILLYFLILSHAKWKHGCCEYDDFWNLCFWRHMKPSICVICWESLHLLLNLLVDLSTQSWIEGKHPYTEDELILNLKSYFTR